MVASRRSGADVTKFKVGQTAAVGCLVDSCRECASCKAGLEQYCDVGGMIFTYGAPDKNGPDAWTYGGYSTSVTVTEDFVLSVSETLDPAGAAPLLCAGITTYSPLRSGAPVPARRSASSGSAVSVTWASSSRTPSVRTRWCSRPRPRRSPTAMRLGADEAVVSRDADAMQAQAGSFDLILNTVAASHDLDQFTNLLKRDGTMVLVGAPEHAHPSPNVMNLIFRRRTIAGSLIGGLPETQEMLDFCAKHNITCDIELIRMDQINDAYERMLKSDVKYRFVIDMSSLKNS